MKKLLLCMICMIFISCSKFMVIGHRGAMGYETENTLASIQKALDLGVDMIEIDVFKVKSGEIVVFHDDAVERLTDGTGKIEDYSFEELQKLTLIGNHKIPTLKEVLNLMNHQVPLNIELKGANTAQDVNIIMEEYIAEKGWKLKDFVISSFNWDELEKMRSFNSNVAIAVLIENSPLDALPMAKKLHAIAINPSFAALTKETVQEIQAEGYKVYSWTVNAPSDIEKAKEMGINGIFTNYPDRAF